MQTLVIDRCVKTPGLIDRAKKYKVLYTEKGLYLICLGNSDMGEMMRFDSATEIIAAGVIRKIADKFEQQALETEARLEKEGPDALAATPKSYFIPHGKAELFEYKTGGNGWIKLKVRGAGCKLELTVHPQYESVLAGMKQRAGV